MFQVLNRIWRDWIFIFEKFLFFAEIDIFRCFFKNIVGDLIGKVRGRFRNLCRLFRNEEKKEDKMEGEDVIIVSGKNY